MLLPRILFAEWLAHPLAGGLPADAAPWNPLAPLEELLSYHFMQNALLAGSVVAVVAGLVGYFMVVRGESFAGHTLANVGFAGAAGATLVGVAPVVGLLVFGALTALGVAALGERSGRARSRSDIAVGTLLALALGLGLLFERLTTTYASNIYAILFGEPLGVSDQDVRVIAVSAAVTLLGLGIIARPLLFASLDPEVAAARGVPVRLLTYVFLILLAFAAAQAVQVVGVLLIFALLVTPAAIAQQLTARPSRALALSVGLALLVTWIGLLASYFTSYPVGFFITSLAFGAYVAVRLARSIASIGGRARRHAGRDGQALTPATKGVAR